MKYTMLIAAAAACLSISGLRASEIESQSSTPRAHVPHTSAALAAADLIERAERAFATFIKTCNEGRAAQLCAALGGRDALISNLWMFPTHDGKSLFVNFEVRHAGSTSPQKQLVLLEMNGERIARIVNL